MTGPAPVYYLPFEDARGQPTLESLGTCRGATAVRGQGQNQPAASRDTPAGQGRGCSRDFSLEGKYDGTGLALPDWRGRFRLATAGEALTVAVWIKVRDEPWVQDAGIVTTHDTSLANGWSFGIGRAEGQKDGMLYFRVRATAGGDNAHAMDLLTSPRVSSGNWTHVAMAWTAGDEIESAKFWINGEEVAATGESGKAVVRDNPAMPLTVGLRDIEFRPLNGWMDEFRLYDRVLSAAEIAALARPGGAAR